jgi:transposase-like protein
MKNLSGQLLKWMKPTSAESREKTISKTIKSKASEAGELIRKKLSGRQLLDVLEEVSKEECNVVITDEFNGYNLFDHTDNVHLRINHRKEYADGFVHTNNIESFWATLKRGIYGIYHHVSVRHLQKYIDEFCFRWNNRQKDMFDLILVQAVLGY